ncbi:YqgE/AlgH family protein [Parvularcula marina]|uniref:YqgE/AlgH family protein n=1 Tax=Parvularcula marina TaxID=2292771 RepID=UPI0035166DC5
MDSVDDHYSSKGPGLSGRLLISVPSLDDGPFEKSVVLIARHDTEHAFGVIINKPIAGLMAADAVKEVRLSPSLTAESAPVFFGGPCDPQKGIVLHSTEYQSEETIPAGNGMALTATRDALERLYGDQLRPQTSRLIAGHSGWSAGQLDEELRRNLWLDMEATAEFVFRTEPALMWEAAFKSLGVEPVSLSALNTSDPSQLSPLN